MEENPSNPTPSDSMPAEGEPAAGPAADQASGQAAGQPADPIAVDDLLKGSGAGGGERQGTAAGPACHLP